MPDFRLLETTRVDADGSIVLLDRHLHRLQSAARVFGFSCEVDRLRQALIAEAAARVKPARLRVLVAQDGIWAFEFSYPGPAGFKHARLAPFTVSSSDPFLRNKTTNRAIYERARADMPSRTDAILVNERGEVTETTIANIAVLRNGRWVTPPLSCGLLPGTLRAELLEQGEIDEGVILAKDLADGETIRCFNSVRGVYEVQFQAGLLPTVAAS